MEYSDNIEVEPTDTIGSIEKSLQETIEFPIRIYSKSKEKVILF